MRTKTLLMSAAALAAGLICSQAQSNVYSVNIVGYANVPLPSGYALIANVFKAGVSNGILEAVSPAQIPVGATFLFWNGVGFNQAQYAPGFNSPSTLFIDPDSTADVPTPQTPPGTGFFIQNPAGATNLTFVGNVSPNPNSSATNTLPSGYGLVSSILPVAGSVTNAGNNTLNMNLILGATLLTWNGIGFNSAQYAPGFNTPSTVFIDPDTTADVPTPSVTIGQGLFYQNPGSADIWVQTLTLP